MFEKINTANLSLITYVIIKTIILYLLSGARYSDLIKNVPSMSGKWPIPKRVNLCDHKVWSDVKRIDEKELPSKVFLRRFGRKMDEGTKAEMIAKEVAKKRKKKEFRKNLEQEKNVVLQNSLYSLTNYFGSIFITEERPDYQLLYCACALKNALKFSGTHYRKEGFAQLYMIAMKSKIDWDAVKKNSLKFNDVVANFLIRSGSVCMVAANNMDEVAVGNSQTDAPFIVFLTSSDIETPCNGNPCVGTGWFVFRRKSKTNPILLSYEIHHAGRRGVFSGICINGSSTVLTIAFRRKDGIHQFAFEPRIGDFFLLYDELLIRKSANAISVNEGLFFKFSKEIQNWLLEKKNCKHPDEAYYSRYTGGIYTDAYKIFRCGGVYVSPKDEDINGGRISLLYEAYPLAFLAEKAGGLAMDGTMAILSIKGKSTGHTTHFYLGSADNVEHVLKIMKVPTPYDKYIRSYTWDYSDDSTLDFVD